jgi:hypothetical protein
MPLTNVNAIAERLAALGFPAWESIQEPYKGANGLIEYAGNVAVECAAHEHVFRVFKGAIDYPTRRNLEYVAKDLRKALASTRQRSRLREQGTALQSHRRIR